MTSTVNIADIKVGRRFRKDLGDIAALAENIADVGLLQPIVVRPDNTLIDGRRRLDAYKQLGRSDIPVHVVDLDAILRGEFSANTQRKNFTVSEMVAIKRAVDGLEKAAAKARQAKAGPQNGRGAKVSGGGKLPQAVKGKTRDKVAAYTGIGARSLTKAEEIVAAAEAEPEKFGKLVEDMDRTGRVDGPFKRLKVMRQAEAIRAEPPPLPGRGPYRVIVADPPWSYEKRDEDPSHRGVLPYSSMSVDQICAMPLSSIAHDDCVLWLWTTNAHMPDAYTVLDAWGFQDKTTLTWAKDKMGLGDWLRGQTEHCLMAIRGKPTVDLKNQTTLLMAPVGRHSEKPAEFYALVEALCPAPRYAELFSRRRYSDRWDCHGDEAQRDAADANGYDAADDFPQSICAAAGGPPWTPPKTQGVSAGSSEAFPF